jgi:hypothetical protein
MSRVLLHLDRDSVAAGDDVDSHVEERAVDERVPLGRSVGLLLRDGYLPAIEGGRSTWVIRRSRMGEPLAVVSVRSGELDRVWAVHDEYLELAEVGGSLFFEYAAQDDAADLLRRV